MTSDELPPPTPDSEYRAQYARAQTMLAGLQKMLEHHARDQAARLPHRNYAAEFDEVCEKLGEAAIAITPVAW